MKILIEEDKRTDCTTNWATKYEDGSGDRIVVLRLNERSALFELIPAHAISVGGTEKFAMKAVKVGKLEGDHVATVIYDAAIAFWVLEINFARIAVDCADVATVVRVRGEAAIFDIL